MGRISTGLVSVEPGGTIVTEWVGDDAVTLSNVTAPASSPIVIEGVANFVKARLSTTSFELVTPHAGAGGDDLPCAISALTETETSIGTLNARTATVIQQLSALDANGRGLFYNLIGVTGDNDPGPGKLAFNNADPELVTEIYLDILDANEGGRDVSGLLGLWVDQTIIIVRSLDTNAYAAYELTGAVTVAGGYAKAEVTYVGHDGTLAEEPAAVEWRLPGVLDATPFWQTRISADADALAARAGLGLIKQTSVSDATAGRLMGVGAFGLGASLVVTEVDLNNYTVPGIYITPGNPTNLPPGFAAGRVILVVGGGSTSYGAHHAIDPSTGLSATRGYNNGTGTWSPWVVNGLPGSIVSSWHTAFSTLSSTTIAVPVDNTLPTASEGLQVLSITTGVLKKATNKLRIRFKGLAGSSAIGGVVASIHLNGAAAARTTFAIARSLSDPYPLEAEYEYTPGSASSVTITVRVGPQTAGTTLYINSLGGSALFGGALAWTMTVEEIQG